MANPAENRGFFARHSAINLTRPRPGLYDEVCFFKFQLIIFEGIRSERKLVETASLHMAHRWCLGYALDEALPDQSSLTRIRQRLGVEIFARFFERVVDLCQEVGLIWGQELFVDATKAAADADFDSLMPRFAYAAKRHLDGLFAGDAPMSRRPPHRTPTRCSRPESSGCETSTRMAPLRPVGNVRDRCLRSGGWIQTGRPTAPTIE